VLTKESMGMVSQTVAEAQAWSDNILKSYDLVLWDERLAIITLIRDLSLHVKQLQIELLAMEERCERRHNE
jgi:hypothetical protein